LHAEHRLRADGKPLHAPEIRAARTGYLAGEQFTFADINLMPILHRLKQAPEGNTALAGARNLAADYARHAHGPSFQRTDPQPARRKPDALVLAQYGAQ
jgi:glutathione S-transferase